MELIGAHQILGLLGNLTVLRRQKLRAHRRIQHIQKDGGELLLTAGIGKVTHQMANQRLRHAGVHAVHGHVVSVVGRPSQRQLRHVAGTDDHAV